MSDHDDRVEVEELEASGLFDGAWYLLQNEDVRGSDLTPLLHFSRFGWREGRRPNAYFDPAWYLERYPDVSAADINPLLHYLRHGENEGRRPSWHFDPAWYRAAYDLPADAVVLAHFLTQRTSGRFAPEPELWAVLHLAPYCDDPTSADDPFAHYLDNVAREECEPFPDLRVVAASGLIDSNHYMINGPDVHAAAIDANEHFCRQGWREARRPNLCFDVHWYLHTNPGVARLKINPLVHYILEGEAAGRRPVPYFDPGWYRATYGIAPGQNALAHYLAHRRSQQHSPTPLFDVAWYVAHHADEVGADRDPFAHYLRAGTSRDIDPSPRFSSREYRRRHLGRPSRHFPQLMLPDRDNPLVHHLRAEYH
jgi:hypothetical protein